MRTINIHEARTHLSRLVERAAEGEAFVIAKAGRPMVKVVPLGESATGPRRLGFMSGAARIPEDFDTMGAAVVATLFEGAPAPRRRRAR